MLRNSLVTWWASIAPPLEAMEQAHLPPFPSHHFFFPSLHAAKPLFNAARRSGGAHPDFCISRVKYGDFCCFRAVTYVALTLCYKLFCLHWFRTAYAVSGVYHKFVECDECKEVPVRGIRWKCDVCFDYDLCHKCYMSNKHDVAHEFIRRDVPTFDGYKLAVVFREDRAMPSVCPINTQL